MIERSRFLYLRKFTLVFLSLLFIGLLLPQPSEAIELPTSDVWAWGYNISGQIGDGTTINRSLPVQVSNMTWATEVSCGGLFSLALKSDGTVWSWGYNASGQLGNGNSTNSLDPVQVCGLSGITSISAGTLHSLALKSDGTVWAWGNNDYGQLGDGTTDNCFSPVQVSGLTDVTAISAGGFHSLALKSDGTVWSWGYNNYGQLGDGSITERHNPVQVSGLTDVTAISAGGFHSLALKFDGTVRSWGYNNFGQLGDDTSTDRHAPVYVTGLNSVVRIAAGGLHSLALKSDGTVWAWGNNGNGRLGDGTTTDRIIPVQVGEISGVIDISGGGCHSIALKVDGTVWTWGNNNYGQLGDGTSTDRYIPVIVIGADRATGIGTGCQSYNNLVVIPIVTVVTSDATSITALGARLNGSLTNMIAGSTAEVSFQWGTQAGIYTNETISQQLSAPMSFHFDLGYLNPKTTYHFRTKAVGDGTVYGNDKTFTTLAIPPSVSTDNASNITATGATLNGVLNEMGSANNVTVSFEWGLTDSYGNTTDPQLFTAEGVFNADLTSLSPKTTYHYRTVALGDGTIYGSDLTFITAPVPPSVATNSNATNLSWNTVTLSGYLNDLGTASSVMVSFEWGLTTSYGNDTTAQQMVAAGPFILNINSGLSPATTYHFRAKAMGDVDAYGDDYTFTTISPPWDVNLDRSVDVNDIVAIGLHWQETGTSGWIPEDVNTDGVVDVNDVVLIGLHWNESW
ncbi:MAG: hypothetical protein JW967_11010 [Dehalococcoidales bacterium]|nr:hypothetical protein [Dehalococcoidales bacterium]